MLCKCTLESVCRAWSFLEEPLSHFGPLQCGGAFNYAWLGCIREAMCQLIAPGQWRHPPAVFDQLLRQSCWEGCLVSTGGPHWHLGMWLSWLRQQPAYLGPPSLVSSSVLADPLLALEGSCRDRSLLPCQVDRQPVGPGFPHVRYVCTAGQGPSAGSWL